AREPVAGGLGALRETQGFGDAQEKPREKEPCIAARKGGQGRCRAPQERAPTADAGHAETVDHEACGNLQQGVAPEECAEQHPEIGWCQVKRALELRGGDRNADAVEVVDQHAGAEQSGHAPAKAGNVAGALVHQASVCSLSFETMAAARAAESASSRSPKVETRASAISRSSR